MLNFIPIMHRTLIVGAGATGSIIAAEIVRRIKIPMQITIWEKARGAGGRMSTARSPADDECRADIGAQYLSTTAAERRLYEPYYKELLAQNLLREIHKNQLEAIPGFRSSSSESMYFACSQGTASIVKYFLRTALAQQPADAAANVQVHYQKKLSSLTRSNSADNKFTWAAQSDDGESVVFDTVILTLPVPQILDLEIIPSLSSDENADALKKLRAVEFSSRYAVALFFSRNAIFTSTFPLIKFYDDDPVMRYASSCTAMRGQADSPVSLVFHTTTAFGAEHVDRDKDAVEKRVMEHLRTTLEPNLPYERLSSIKFHRWRYSQVTTPYAGELGYVMLSEKPLLLCAGDGFSRSNFNGCLESALNTVAILSSKICT